MDYFYSSSGNEGVVIIIQARTGSKRFPNKILAKVNGKKLIDYSIDAAIISGISFVVAIPEHDTKLIDYLEFRRIPHYCGSELDVLDRFYCCAANYHAETIIRLCGDTLYTIDDITQQMKLYKERKKFTYGNGVFIFSFKELEYAWKNATGSHREHVTTYLYNCIDYPEDLERLPL